MNPQKGKPIRPTLHRRFNQKNIRMVGVARPHDEDFFLLLRPALFCFVVLVPAAGVRRATWRAALN